MHIIVPVQKNGRLAGTGLQPFAIDQRMPLSRCCRCLDQPHVLESRRTQAVGHKLRCAAHVAGMCRQGRDRRHAQQLLQLLHETSTMFPCVCDRYLGTRPCSRCHAIILPRAFGPKLARLDHRATVLLGMVPIAGSASWCRPWRPRTWQLGIFNTGQFSRNDRRYP